MGTVFAAARHVAELLDRVELVVTVTVGDTVQPGFGTVGHDVEAVEGVDDSMGHADVGGDGLELDTLVGLADRWWGDTVQLSILVGGDQATLGVGGQGDPGTLLFDRDRVEQFHLESRGRGDSFHRGRQGCGRLFSLQGNRRQFDAAFPAARVEPQLHQIAVAVKEHVVVGPVFAIGAELECLGPGLAEAFPGFGFPEHLPVDATAETGPQRQPVPTGRDGHRDDHVRMISRALNSQHTVGHLEAAILDGGPARRILLEAPGRQWLGFVGQAGGNCCGNKQQTGSQGRSMGAHGGSSSEFMVVSRP